MSGRLSAGLLLHAAMQMHAAGSSVDACKESDRREKLDHQRQAGSPLLAVTVSAVRTRSSTPNKKEKSKAALLACTLLLRRVEGDVLMEGGVEVVLTGVGNGGGCDEIGLEMAGSVVGYARGL